MRKTKLHWLLASLLLVALSACLLFAEEPRPKTTNRPFKVAAIVTLYRHNTHADVIVSRLLQTDTLDGKGRVSPLELVSLYVDQRTEADTSQALAKKHKFRLCDTVGEALTLGGDKLAVDGILLVAEHGSYPQSETGQTVYPKRRLFSQIAEVVEQSDHPVPIFSDKHLADNWADAKWLYDTAKRLKAPLMAGSSLPTAWRDPQIDVRRGAKLKEIVVISYGPLDAYGFHALETAQCLVERRRGGETGVAAVQCLQGDAVWQAEKQGLYDRRLLDATLSRLKERPLPAGKNLEDLVPNPVLFVVDYKDGLRANIFTLNGAVAEWAAAWRDAENGQESSTLFAVQNARPYMHFAYLLQGVEKMHQSGKPTWPVERTLLTSGMLDSLFISKKKGGKRLLTPHLDIVYQSGWNWRQPPPPPPGRPSKEQ